MTYTRKSKKLIIKTLINPNNTELLDAALNPINSEELLTKQLYVRKCGHNDFFPYNWEYYDFAPNLLIFSSNFIKNKISTGGAGQEHLSEVLKLDEASSQKEFLIYIRIILTPYQ